MKKLVLILFIALCYSCASTRYLDTREKEFGTKGTNAWSFHRLSDRDKGTSLVFPGYIVGLEKAYRKNIGAPKLSQIKKGNALKELGYKQDVFEWKNLHKHKRWILNDGKPTFVSNIFEFKLSEKEHLNRIKVKPLYDAYDNAHLSIPTEAYYKGYRELMHFGDKIVKEIEEKKITHVFLMSMGWNTDQQEAVRNFNSLFSKILDNSNKEDVNFKPLFIGFTWPSQWPIPVISIFNKANDADEIGMKWFNFLLHDKLLNVKNKLNFKTVVLGHSFGARLTSRAVMSADMLANQSKPVDLLINLESAYSIHRYSKNRGNKGINEYYHWDKYVNNVALVLSEHDKATSVPFWTTYAGEKSAKHEVTKNAEDYNNIEVKNYVPGLKFNKKKQFLLIDASSIVRMNAYNKGGKAHSDIYNTQVATMLWGLIKSSTF